MRKERGVLGRGLASILGSNEDNSHLSKKNISQSPESNIGNIYNILLSEIIVNPFQPRKEFNQEKLNELAISIEQLGLIQPITVRKMKDKNFQLISGERRVRAAKLIGLTEIPAFIRIANDQEMLEMALVENIQREDLDPIEIALSYERLTKEIKLTQEECSERVGKSRSTITNFLRLLKLPEIIQKGLRDRSISNGHARALLSIQNEETQINLFHDIVANGYSVREIEQIAKEFSNKYYRRTSNSPTISPLSFSHQKIIHDLSKNIKAEVRLKCSKKGKGKLIIQFENDEDLTRIIKKINN